MSKKEKQKSFRVKRKSVKPDIRFTHPKLNDPMCLVATEEAGTLWLWAWPELLGWTEHITWLFSPVVGNQRWTGDLWGIDACGNLLLVETKRAKHKETHDPFVDFLQGKRARPIPPVTTIRAHWAALWQAEQKFLQQCQTALEQGVREEPLQTWRGVVPYSLKRLMVWWWRKLYLQAIAPRLNDAYAATVDRLLKLREQERNRAVYYFGLFTVVNSSEPKLSPLGVTHREYLNAKVSESQAYVRGVELTPLAGNEVEIYSYPLPRLE